MIVLVGGRLVGWFPVWDGGPVDLMCCLVGVSFFIIICCVAVCVVVGGVSRSIGGCLHERVGELLGCHYFMCQMVGSG